MLISPTIRALLGKELRQIRRSRNALLSSTLLPLLLLVVAPMGQLSAVTAAVPGSPLPGLAPLPGMADMSEPVDLFLKFLFPMFVMMGGLVVPSVAATYTVVAERERRTLDLLMALPVRVVDVIGAKLLAMLVIAFGVVLPLFLFDVVVLSLNGLVTPGYLLLLLLVLFAALTCSVAIALVLALVARDFRTANNLNGIMIGPIILLTIGILFGVPGDLRFLVQAAMLLLLAGIALLAGLRWLTFERYLA